MTTRSIRRAAQTYADTFGITMAAAEVVAATSNATDEDVEAGLDMAAELAEALALGRRFYIDTSDLTPEAADWVEAVSRCDPVELAEAVLVLMALDDTLDAGGGRAPGPVAAERYRALRASGGPFSGAIWDRAS